MYSKLAEVNKFQADFNDKEPAVNRLSLSIDSQLLATGGDDNIVRLYTLSKDCRKAEKVSQYSLAQKAITGINISPGKSVLAISSQDGNAYVVDLKSGKLI